MNYYCLLFKSGFYIGNFCLQIYCKHLASGVVFLFRIYSKNILRCHLKLNDFFFLIAVILISELIYLEDLFRNK